MTKREDQEGGTATRGWQEPVQEPDSVSLAELDAWRSATRRVREIAVRDGFSAAEVARRADMPGPTFSLWYSGKYTGAVAGQTARVLRWLDSYEEGRSLDAQLRSEPDWVSTPTSEEVVKTLFLAQKLPDMVLVTLGSGMGKTITARHYVANRPSAYLVTMRPTTSSISSMLAEIAMALDISERNPVALDRAIGAKLRRNGRETLLIVDEAQNLVDKAVDQLRYFIDQFSCGIALLGNNELYSRFGRGEPRRATDRSTAAPASAWCG